MTTRRRPRPSPSAILLALAIALGAAGGCSNDRKDHPKVDTTSAGVVGAAPASSIKPGSHEDWCPEHQVPESLCTRCNPPLSDAFKATGDWCVEHALPESQCRKCNPQINIVRPPKTPGG